MATRKIADGGPAFPASAIVDVFGDVKDDPSQGMTLRDWFAGQALAGFCSADEMASDPHLLAADAYLLADAMLEARR